MKYAAALMILGGFLLTWPTPGTGPKPEPRPDQASIVATYNTLRDLMVILTEAELDELRAGRLTEESAFAEFNRTGRKKAEDAAFAPIEAAQVEAMRDGWTPEKQIKHLQQVLSP